MAKSAVEAATGPQAAAPLTLTVSGVMNHSRFQVAILMSEGEPAAAEAAINHVMKHRARIFMRATMASPPALLHATATADGAPAALIHGEVEAVLIVGLRVIRQR